MKFQTLTVKNQILPKNQPELKDSPPRQTVHKIISAPFTAFHTVLLVSQTSELYNFVTNHAFS